MNFLQNNDTIIFLNKYSYIINKYDYNKPAMNYKDS